MQRNKLLTKTKRTMLNELFREVLPNYYDNTMKGEQLAYMHNVNKVLDEARKRIKQRQVDAEVEMNREAAFAYKMALIEIAFISSEIMLEQQKESLTNK